MTDYVSRKRDPNRRLLLSGARVVAVAIAIMFGPANATPCGAQSPQTTVEPLPSFEVASIRPNRSGGLEKSMITPDRFIITRVTTRRLIEMAYSLNSENQLSGGPSWLNSDKYDIDAKVEDSLAQKLQRYPDQWPEQLKRMIQSLLADRFRLKVSHETKDLPVYAVVVGENGPKLTQAEVSPPPPMIKLERGKLIANGMPMSNLAVLLSHQPELGGRKVLDHTGLTGNYVFTLQWAPDEAQTPMFKGTGDESQESANAPTDSSGPSIFSAIQDQLGLKLESQKGPVEVLVIDQIEKPSEN